MRSIPKRSIASLLTIVSLCCVSAVRADGRPFVVRVSDITRAEAKGSTVEVLVTGPKAKQLAGKGKTIPIEILFPTAHPMARFVCEIRAHGNIATINFKFADKAAATDFAEELYVAKAKVASQCDCH
jgi:hypothetical protein